MKFLKPNCFVRQQTMPKTNRQHFQSLAFFGAHHVFRIVQAILLSTVFGVSSMQRFKDARNLSLMRWKIPLHFIFITVVA